MALRIPADLHFPVIAASDDASLVQTGRFKFWVKEPVVMDYGRTYYHYNASDEDARVEIYYDVDAWPLVRRETLPLRVSVTSEDLGLSDIAEAMSEAIALHKALGRDKVHSGE